MTALHRRPRFHTLPPHAKLSQLFWRLAEPSGASTESREPEDVVRHAIASMDALAGRSAAPVAGALDFLVELEHDPYYAAPELRRGGDKDSRALVFSLGVVIFERLTGHHPFVPADGRGLGVGSGAATTLCTIPGALRATLSRAMSPFPGDRFLDERALRAALARFVAGERLDTSQVRRPGTPPPPAPRSSERLQLDATLARVRAASAPPALPSDPRLGSVAPERRDITEEVPALALPLSQRHATALRWATGVALVFAINAVGWAVVGSSDSRTSRAEPTAAPATASATARGVVSTPAPAHAAIEIDAALVPARAGAAEPTDAEAAAQALASAASGPTAASEPVSIELEPSERVFSVEAAGPEIAAAARSCLAPGERRVDLGLSVRFSAEDGAIERVFFGQYVPGPPGARDCLIEALTEISAGAAPARATIATFAVRLTPHGDRARGRVR